LIEEYPASDNPDKDSINDVPDKLNLNIAREATRLALAGLCTLAEIIE
jgi:hypothetical protein